MRAATPALKPRPNLANGDHSPQALRRGTQDSSGDKSRSSSCSGVQAPTNSARHWEDQGSARSPSGPGSLPDGTVQLESDLAGPEDLARDAPCGEWPNPEPKPVDLGGEESCVLSEFLFTEIVSPSNWNKTGSCGMSPITSQSNAQILTPRPRSWCNQAYDAMQCEHQKSPAGRTQHQHC